MKYLLLLIVLPAVAMAQKSYEKEPINYSESTPIDQVSHYFSDPSNLASWKLEGSSGYLMSFLEAFDIPADSQTLVFSKTSLQSKRITPQNPRALYFNDEIYVGWVPKGDILEISVPSPTTGTNFYTINNSEGLPTLLRETNDCLRCHGESFTRDIPGHVVRSVFPAKTGHPIFKAGTELVDQSTPISKRWGGWIVTGTHLPHRGNQLFEESDQGAEFSQNITIKDIPENGYPVRSSDAIALMILDHQTDVHNQLANLVLQTQKALYDQKIMDDVLERTEPLSESTQRRLKYSANKVLRSLFFADEVRMPRLEIKRSKFARSFQERDPQTSGGDSLFQLKMDGRMFKYPLSYLIYSQTMDELPEAAQRFIWPEIKRILESPENERDYKHLSQIDKQAILSILKETHPKFKTAQ